MEITKTQKQLIALLKALKLKMNIVIGIMLTLQKEAQQKEMMNYIITNKDTITEEQILDKMEKILQN